MGSFYIPPAALSMRGVEHDSSLATNPHWATNKRSVRTVQFGFSVWIRNAEESGIGGRKHSGTDQDLLSETCGDSFLQARFLLATGVCAL